MTFCCTRLGLGGKSVARKLACFHSHASHGMTPRRHDATYVTIDALPVVGTRIPGRSGVTRDMNPSTEDFPDC